TGFNMAALGHSQWRWLPLIQIADLAGSYAVSFLVILVAACFARCLPIDGRRWAAWPLLPAAAAFIAVLAYGYWRLDHAAGRPGPTIALIQGSIDTELKDDPVKRRQIYPHYFALSQQAVDREPELDLIVWPETMYRDSLLSLSDDAIAPPTWPATLDEIREEVPRRKQLIAEQAHLLGTPLLLGLDYLHLGPRGVDHYNSALFVSRDGVLGPRYDKTHPVPFGEFMPLARRFEWLAELSPIGAGIDWGTDVPVFQVAETRLAANICYESAIPHLIREQVATLRDKGEEPDILVNLTNDGWFRGSSELDLHLTCAVYRAVECRKPFLIAANTGFSAWIDSDGRIIERGPRREADVIIAKPRLDDRRSPYLALGDWPAGICLFLTCCVGMFGLGKASGRRKPPGGTIDSPA
ncbi:MAG: apolipoprotein N-acyltransferase, partial [Pirellulales bacterium]